MSDQETQQQAALKRSFLSKATVVLVRIFGSWLSVLVHSIFFASWLLIGENLELLLVIVSLEAIYIGIFILMAENAETAERDHIQELKRQQDMKVVKQDARIDEKSLSELKQIRKQINTLHNLIDQFADKK